MRRVVVAVALVALALPVAAQAKGPTSASISGPGLSGALAVTGDGEITGTALGRLAMTGGFFAQVFGQTPDPTFASRPVGAGALGPRYKTVYVVPGPNGIESRLVQWLYPYAKSGPLTYMRPGQMFWDGKQAHGGWFRATGMRRILVRMGLPAVAPA
jgi:hypothetical protein